MGEQMVWVTRGPEAGSFLQMTDADAIQAEKDGWAERTAGRDAYSFSPAMRIPHEKAEAWRDRRAGYFNRELRPATEQPPPAPATPLIEVTDPPEDAAEETAGVTIPRKRGRPPKQH